jgi:hypothetical protein
VSIKDRMRRLEGKAGCPECGNVSPAIHAVYPGEEEPEPEYCPRCDRSLTVLMRVVYEDVRGEGYSY